MKLTDRMLILPIEPGYFIMIFEASKPLISTKTKYLWPAQPHDLPPSQPCTFGRRLDGTPQASSKLSTPSRWNTDEPGRSPPDTVLPGSHVCANVFVLCRTFCGWLCPSVFRACLRRYRTRRGHSVQALAGPTFKTASNSGIRDPGAARIFLILALFHPENRLAILAMIVVSPE